MFFMFFALTNYLLFFPKGYNSKGVVTFDIWTGEFLLLTCKKVLSTLWVSATERKEREKDSFFITAYLGNPDLLYTIQTATNRLFVNYVYPQT